MSLLDEIRGRALDVRNAPVPVETSALSDEFGHDQSRFSPPEYGDYLATSSDVFSCVSLRARLMSKLDPVLFRGQGPDKREVTSGRAFEVLRKVNPFWTWARLQRMDEMSMGLWGETFWALEPNRFGEPQEIWWLKPSRVTPVPDASNYLKGFLYHPADGSEAIPFSPQEIVWFRYPNPIDEFSPLSPIAAARLAAETGSAMMKSNRHLFSQGMQAGGFVTPKDGRTSFSPEQADQLEEMLRRRFKGVDKAHRWAVLRFEAQFDAVQLTPKDAEWVEGMRVNLRTVCNAYGIPSPLQNDMEFATLSNAREYERILWVHTLIPDADLRADEIEEQFLTRFVSQRRPDHVEFDTSKIPALQESASEAWGRERQAIEVGGLTINEWRKKHGLPEVLWGDVWWAPVNKVPVSDDGMPTQNSDSQGLISAIASEVARQIAPQDTQGNSEELERRLQELEGRSFETVVLERDAAGRVQRTVRRPVTSNGHGLK